MAVPSYVCSEEGPCSIFHNLVYLLDEAAKEDGDKPAHIFRLLKNRNDEQALVREVVTFKDMADKSLALAASLLEVGMKPGDTLAIAANNCPEWLYVEYACLRIKVIMIRLPINIIEKNALIPTLRKFSCRALVVDEIIAVKLNAFLQDYFLGRCADDLKDLKYVFALDSVPACTRLAQTIRTVNSMAVSAANKQSVFAVQSTIDPEDLAVVYPTSGTTGEPKFPAFTHLALIKHYYNRNRDRPKQEDDIVYSDRAFSWSGGYVFGPLLSRSTSICVDGRLTADGRSTEVVYKIIEEEQVTQAVFLPYMLHDAMRAKETGIATPASLRRVITFGERLTTNLVEFAVRTFKTLVVIYGATEIISACASVISLDDIRNLHSVPLMRCFPGYEIKITAENGRVVSRGETGHIQIRSLCTMIGYYLAPEESKDAKSENGWITTGDVGVMKENGLVEVTGRIHDVISRGTTKIYPKTIEDILLEHPKVQEVAVIGVPDPRLFQEVCACVILKPDAEQTGEEDLKEYIASKMIDDSFLPKYYIFMADIPRSSTGKTDIKGLVKKAIVTLGLN